MTEVPEAVLGRALVITASNRAAVGVYPDRGGPLLAEALIGWGFVVDGPLVVPDGEPVADALRSAVAGGYDVVLTTGGTGLSPTDRTPEATRGLLDREIPGLAEAIRTYGSTHGVPTAVLSRGLAGVAGTTLVVNLPGSTGGCRDGLAVLDGVLTHAVRQIRGEDHPNSSFGSTNPAPRIDAHSVTGEVYGAKAHGDSGMDEHIHGPGYDDCGPDHALGAGADHAPGAGHAYGPGNTHGPGPGAGHGHGPHGPGHGHG